MRARLTAAIQAALGAGWRAELAALAVIGALAAVVRFANLPGRGGWDADQAVEMEAMRRAVESGSLPTFGPEAISIGSSFHHGALYYDLLLPAAWLGGGDPTFVVAEIALLSLLVVPIVWWLARSMAGVAAGLISALLAAVSASLIGYGTFIWNPTLVEPAAALAFLGAWQAWRTANPRWWIVAAAGTAVAAQAHVAAAVLVLPMAAVFVADLRRGAVSRRRIAAWGVAAAALVAATYAPVAVYELGHDFAETRGILGYLAGPDTTPARDPVTRVLFGGVRILAWPLTRWPLIDLRPAFLPALAVAMSLVWGLLWRLLPGRASSSEERRGVRFTAGLLALIVLALGLGLKAVSVVQELPTEQYHVAADPLVFVAAGLVLGALWRAGAGRPRARGLARGLVVATLVGLCAWNAVRWPPLTSGDGGWPAAQRAADRIEGVAGGSGIALVPLFVEKGVDAYSYPLALDGVQLVAPAQAGTVIVLCDRFWLVGCGGEAEERWRSSQADAANLTLVDRFDAAPDRVLSVYRRAP
jgi:4-amino-4-deoxy-L-arabinose transferase-like glycosyltransferase